MLARPVLRRVLGETGATPYERALLDGVRARLTAEEPKRKDAASVAAVLGALLLALEDPGGADTRTALDRMWEKQHLDGERSGTWTWFSLKLDPWEVTESDFFGASLAALAAGTAAPDTRNAGRLDALAAFFLRERDRQPLHNRLTVLWAASRVPKLAGKEWRKKVVAEALAKQQPDGGWTIESLGPWMEHTDAPPSTGSHSYATAYTAFTLRKAGVKTSHAALRKATAWLKSRQEPESGAWDARSMNKNFPAGSMESQFMRDAATAFAVLAIAGK